MPWARNLPLHRAAFFSVIFNTAAISWF